MAMDKQRNGTAVEDLVYERDQIQAANQQVRVQVDDIFIKRKQLQNEKEVTQQKIERLKSFIEIKLKELSDEDQEEYQKKRIQVKELAQSNKLLLNKLDQLLQKSQNYEIQFKKDTNRVKSFSLQQEITQTRNRHQQLLQQLKDSQLSFDEIREKLLDQVQIYKKDLMELDQRAKDLRKVRDLNDGKLQKINDQLLEGEQQGQSFKQKYQVLFQKEQQTIDEQLFIEKKIIEQTQ